MATNLNNSNVATRENRIGSITGYIGSLKDLATQSECGTLKGCSRCFSQSSSCLSSCALGQLSAIRDIALIHHGPAGCSVAAAGTYYLDKVMAKKRGVTTSTVYVGTDMNENDTIFGSTKALKDIILEVNKRYSPKAIFVSSSCATGIIGEDIDSVVDEVKEQIEVPVIAVHCEGFKSRIWATGFDIADHAVLSGIVQPPREGIKSNRINFKNFYESARPEIIEMFKQFDLDPIFLYCNSTVEELSHMSEAIATTCICGTLGNYLGNVLEEKYGVPYIRSINQCGIVGFETWLREIGRVTGRSEKIEKYIEEQRAIYLPKIEEVKKELKGLRAVLGMGPGYTFEVSRVLNELGIEVVWALAWHYDKKYENGDVPPSMKYLLDNDIDFEASVADQQNYEVMNILNKYQPDLYLSRHPGSTVWAIKNGTPAVYVADEYMIFGYKHTLDFAYSILDSIKNRSFEKNLAKRTRLPYTDWWYKQNVDKFLTQEKA
ncbi:MULTISPECIES: nitrogenase component 1 [unclassified Butyrivibrio]|jgi:nitrogenase molybdenum-iron protein alpha chain|uniref:nitrogenase component 1 n=1 Tax=unclassified Butyrivibrio TaxID=2639466 RepID=UPI0003B5B163|nr:MULTISPECIES: nitrogenase component 1 [unclassified Butyrivibrio]MDC7295020.1 nitrogenase [Butyrivibrio sp. DSM 10294]